MNENDDTGKNGGKDYLSARIPVETRDAFWNTRPRGITKEFLLETAAKLWIDLPPELRGDLLSQSLSGSTLIDLVQKVVNDTIAAGHEAGQEVRKRQTQKRQQEGGGGNQGGQGG